VLPDELWLKKHGTRSIVYRKTLEDDVAAMDAYRPDLVFGTTPFANEAKARGIPAMYFTNQLAARPFFLSAGMAATVDFIRATLDGSPRYAWMEEFFRLSPSDAAEAA
jgi:chlorophyllide a reductase subunit Y